MSIIANTRYNVRTTAGNNNARQESKFYIPMFQGKAYPVFLSGNSRLSGYILPGFDESLALNDAARPMSVSPYRSVNIKDEVTGQPAFTNWRLWVEGYMFYGTGKNSFLSPKTVGAADPIEDLFWAAWRKHNKEGREEFKTLYKQPEGRKPTRDDILPLPRKAKMMIVNAVCPPSYDKAEDQSEQVRPLVLKTGAGNALEDDLNMRTPLDNTPVDPEWRAYYLGDFCHPSHCVRFTQMERPLGGFKGQGLSLYSTSTDARGNATYSVNLAPEDEVRAWLPSRYDLDSRTFLYIPTYDEIVYLVWQEGLVPHDFVEEVCRDKCMNWSAIVEGKRGALVTARPRSEDKKKDEDDIPYDNVAPTAPAPATPAPAAPPMPATPAAPAPAPAAPAPAPVAQYWVTVDGAVVSWDENMLRARIASGFNGPIMKHGESVWRDAAFYGLIVVPAAPPMPAPAPAPAPVPPPPAAPSMPSVATMPPLSKPVVATADGTRTAEEEALYKQLEAKAMSADSNLTDPEFMQLVELQAKAPYAG